MTKKLFQGENNSILFRGTALGTEIVITQCYQYCSVVPKFVPVVPEFVLFRESL